MKNEIHVRMDSGGKPHIVLGKPADANQDLEDYPMEVADMVTLCEALVTVMHTANARRIKPIGQSLEDCIEHLRKGAADDSFKTPLA